ncbi:AI-2E family transporter [Ramlibacter ginsenosidimutans]|uniref:AI-2E family transporter n=2 Tax=Ramlibacter ginsenosidimutans TaxID=502333 RepID=A0A934WMX5_9BURK|nr:AI-2E family transporter [Ramlibacter ginsenosidimutans]
MLYFGRAFLAPLALAAILSLVIAPLKRKLARIGLGHAAGALVSVVLVGASLAGVATLLASQLVTIASDLPQYQEAVRAKLEDARELTVRPLEQIETVLRTVLPPAHPTAASKPRGRREQAAADLQTAPVRSSAPTTATEAITWLFSFVWGPVGQAGIVLVLLVFILLEHEGLRDRAISLAGEAEAGRTMRAVEDAAQGVSRFFLSQFVVNVTFALVLGAALWIVGVPHAALWGALGGLARFVPYVGALAAGAAIAAFAAAVDPGWSLMFWSAGLFVGLESVAVHLVEPRVYGQSSGLAPLGVIVSALFWGALWGPLGLLLSTPMTLCLVVAGRHVRALEPISILFGEAPGLTAGLRLYQRALSGEPGEIVAAARVYLRRSNFARYCDQILLPGLALAAADFRAGRIGSEQQDRIRQTIAAVAQSLSVVKRQEGASRKRRSISLLEANVGAHLRAMRDQGLGRWQRAQPLRAAPVVLCAGLGTTRDDVLTQLLVQALRDEGIQAASLSLGRTPDAPHEGKSDPFSTVFLVYPLEETQDAWQAAAKDVCAAFPKAMLLTIKLPLEEGVADEAVVQGHVDLLVRSFSEAVAFELGGRLEAAD